MNARKNNRGSRFCGSLALIVTSAGFSLGAHAQNADGPSAEGQADPLQQIVVTGSRIARSGFETPSPVTVMGEEELKALSVTNIGVAVSQLPAFRASTNPTTNGFGSFDVPALKDQELEVFAVINHLFDKTPPFAPEGQYPTNPTYFDQIGRTYRLGVRLNF